MSFGARRPGAGFVVLVAAIAGSGAFFAWGARTPPLDEVWRLQQDLRLGDRGALSHRELVLLQQQLRRHPEIAEALLEGAPHGLISAAEVGRVETGAAYFVRRQPDPPLRLRVLPDERKPTKVPIPVSAWVNGERSAGTLGPDVPFGWDLPQEGPFPQLVEIRVEGAAAPFVVDVQVRR